MKKVKKKKIIQFFPDNNNDRKCNLKKPSRIPQIKINQKGERCLR